MKPYLQDSDFTLYRGDALATLKELPSESVHMCVTSPPFYGLRDYGTGTWEGGDAECDHVRDVHKYANGCIGCGAPMQETTEGCRHCIDRHAKRRKHGTPPERNYDTPPEDHWERPRARDQVTQAGQTFREVCGKCGARRIDQQIGLEPTPEEWVARLVEVFREVKRVLRKDGTLWVEVGDSYNSHPSGERPTASLNHGLPQPTYTAGTGQGPVKSLKPKDLIGAPGLLARALQAPYYTGRIKDESDRVWLAAMIDGEGCIGIHRKPAGTKTHSTYTRKDGTVAQYEHKKDSFQPKLEISNTNLELIERVVAITGYGNTRVKQHAGTFGRKQTLYRWCVTADKAREILREVYPHLVAKQHEARLGYGLPSSGEQAAAAWKALKLLHAGSETTVDFKAPPPLWEEGWFLRSDIIWARLPPNPMPESVTDRPTKSHSYVFLFSKSARYFFDQEAVREPPSPTSHPGTRRSVAVEPLEPDSGLPMRTRGGLHRVGAHAPGSDGAGRNIRSVWTIPTEPLPDEHYAAFPQKLVEPCIKAGTSERGCCPECGAPWVRVVEKPENPFPGSSHTHERDAEQGGTQSHASGKPAGTIMAQRWYAKGAGGQTLGWQPLCLCEAQPVPATVLDPFLGSGTTALVARRLGRRCIGIELNERYCEMAARRTQQLALA